MKTQIFLILFLLPILHTPAKASACDWESLKAQAIGGDISGLQAARLSCPGLSTLTNTKGETLLFFAAEGDSLDVMKWLLETQSEVNARAEDGCSALCRVTSLEAAEILLKEGARLDISDRLGRSAFHLLLPTKNWPLLDHLLLAGAKVSLKDIEWASAYMEHETLAFLADRASPELISGSGKYFSNFFFHEESQRQVAKTLLAKGADLNLAVGRTLIENYVEEYVKNGPQYQRHGLTALRFLLENGAHANGTYSLHDIPSLFFALAWKTEEPKVAEEILSLFLVHGFDRNLRSERKHRTLLIEVSAIVAMSPQKRAYAESITGALLTQGFDPQAQGADGRTALHAAIQATNAGAGRLLATVTDLSIRDANGQTPEELLRERMNFYRNAPEYQAALSEILDAIQARK